MLPLYQRILPPHVIEAGREELRRRLALPSRGAADDLRVRLKRRLEPLKTEFEWGDIHVAEYRTKMEETRTELASLPGPEKIMTFDGVAELVSSLASVIAVATSSEWSSSP